MVNMMEERMVIADIQAHMDEVEGKVREEEDTLREDLRIMILMI